MPVTNAGENYNLNDTCILQFDSPRGSVCGPYVVAYHTPSDGERWAVVALDWNGGHALGIRWFWGSRGHPNSAGYSTWFIIPDMFHQSIVEKLVAERKLSPRRGDLLRRFLDGQIDDAGGRGTLRQCWNNP